MSGLCSGQAGVRTWLHNTQPWSESQVTDLSYYLRLVEEGRPPEPKVLASLRRFWRVEARGQMRLGVA